VQPVASIIASLASRLVSKPRAPCACHARERSDHSSAFATRPPGRHESFANRVLLPRGVPLPVRPQRGLAGRRRSSLVRRPTALMGFQIRALRRFHPDDGWNRVAIDAADRSGFFADRLFGAGVSTGPGPRAVGRLSSAPIYFRRGDRPPVEKSEICKSDRPRISVAVRLLGFAPVCGPPPRHS
jgi:hypothetical protein